jgi:hypothetical protein
MAVQIDTIKPTLKVPGTKRLKQKYDKLLSVLLQFCYQFQLAPLHHGAHARAGAADREGNQGRGLLTSTTLLNLSRLCHRNQQSTPPHVTKSARVELQSEQVRPWTKVFSRSSKGFKTTIVVGGRGSHSFPFQLNLSFSVHRTTQIDSCIRPGVAQVELLRERV